MTRALHTAHHVFWHGAFLRCILACLSRTPPGAASTRCDTAVFGIVQDGAARTTGGRGTPEGLPTTHASMLPDWTTSPDAARCRAHGTTAAFYIRDTTAAETATHGKKLPAPLTRTQATSDARSEHTFPCRRRRPARYCAPGHYGFAPAGFLPPSRHHLAPAATCAAGVTRCSTRRFVRHFATLRVFDFL